MFHRIHQLFFFALVAFTVLAAATPTAPKPPTTTTAPGPTQTITVSQCNTGSINCCNSLERADSSAVGVLLGLLGVVLQGVEALVGITCTPIDILGIGQNQCHSQPVCCENNNFNGIIAIGCVPINISL
ncbi:fungal hydrophobin [Dendrothele bispora CBS 962.96]|uniref:Hydrophobin n=1 Tax=Dendrothele bispora (strain CBS 962.96) TaxID=1314807 RepID=A0A4S8M865_DENBC|nr:fungal hydrophobin [Dendrothele bispora CBS 962.96]